MFIIAGPCAIESYDQAMRIAEFVYQAGAYMFRGGLFKPRSSPHDFQGLGENGIHILEDIRKFMPVVTEATQVDNLQLIAENADMIQIGARNMHNIELIRKAGRTGKDILLKRGYAALVKDEWIKSYEYIELERKAYNVQGTTYMCERGIRTYEKYTRNTFDVSVIPFLKLQGHIVVADPSHAAGRPDLIIPISLAAVAAGADALIVEVHDRPDEALCDGHQAISFSQFVELVDKVTALERFMRNNEWSGKYAKN